MSEFDLFVQVGDAPGGYTVLAVSPAGVAREDAALPIAADAFQKMLVRVSSKEQGTAIRSTFGGQLFDAVFRGAVRDTWVTATADPEGVRLRLIIEPPAIALWPWELLHDGQNFVATHAARAVSRYIPVQEPVTLPVVTRLKVLLACASPAALPAIPAGAVARFTAAIAAVADVVVLTECSRSALANAVGSGGFHVVHYLGHGARGHLLLQGATPAEVDPLPDQTLGQMLLGRTATRLVVLTACSSAQSGDGDAFAGVGPSLIRARVPAAVAMQYEFVQLSTAETFSRSLYAELSRGEAVDVAVNRARNAVSSTGDLLSQRDWSTPVLYLGTRNGKLITLTTQQADAVEQAALAVQTAVATDQAAAKGWLELKRTFEQLRLAVTQVKSLGELRELLGQLSLEFQPVATSAAGIGGTQFAAIKASWAQITAGTLPRLRDAAARLDEGAVKTEIQAVLAIADGVTDAIARLAVGDLERRTRELRDALIATNVALGAAVSDTIASLAATSDRTLGRLGAMD